MGVGQLADTQDLGYVLDLQVLQGHAWHAEAAGILVSWRHAAGWACFAEGPHTVHTSPPLTQRPKRPSGPPDHTKQAHHRHRLARVQRRLQLLLGARAAVHHVGVKRGPCRAWQVERANVNVALPSQARHWRSGSKWHELQLLALVRLLPSSCKRNGKPLRDCWMWGS